MVFPLVRARVYRHRHTRSRISVYAAAEAKVPKEPAGLLGDGAIVFGGGAVFNQKNKVCFVLQRLRLGFEPCVEFQSRDRYLRASRLAGLRLAISRLF